MLTRWQTGLLSLGFFLLALPAAPAGDFSFFGPAPYGNRYREWKASRGKGPGAYELALAPCQAPPTRPAPAFFEVRVPAQAEVWINDHKSTQTGVQRIYRSPELEPGQPFRYTVRARWMNGSQEVEQTRELSIAAGGQARVDFTQP